jgi:hypothetical protein
MVLAAVQAVLALVAAFGLNLVGGADGRCGGRRGGAARVVTRSQVTPTASDADGGAVEWFLR